MTPEQKFSADGPFSDPIVRCDSCQTLLLMADIHTHGRCTHCGKTKVTNVQLIRDDEMPRLEALIAEGKLDGDWLKLFEAVA